MPSLSERDLGHVEKLFNAIRSVLEYDHTHRTYSTPVMPSAFTAAAPAAPPSQPGGNRLQQQPVTRGSDSNFASASSPTVTPSKVLQDHQEQHSERSFSRYTTASAHTASSGGAAVSSGVPERRLWAELAFLMWRVAGLQKLSLMAFVTSDPGLMLAELARALLSFLKESCAAAANLGKEGRMRQVALLAQDRLLFLLRVFCSLKNCTLMLSETSGASSAADGRGVFDAICAAVVAGGHFSWMSQIYVWYCDEAARFARSSGAIPSAYVYATHDALRCILGCCTDQETCARAFLYSEPVACVTYMFYGLKLRISTCDVLRPYEDDHALRDPPTATTAAAASAEHSIDRQTTTSSVGSSSPGLPPRHASSPVKHDEDAHQQQQQQQLMCSGPIPLRPPGAKYLKTRYFNSLTVSSSTTSNTQSHREGPIVVNCSAVAGLVRPPTDATTASASPASKANASTSWAFDLPDITREQLKQLLLGGRENSFDALLFNALDVVIEVLRVTRDYGHWMVLSTVSSLLLLSKKNIEVVAAAASAASPSPDSPLSSSLVTPAVPPPSLSQVVAMYENITVMFQFLFSLMQGLDVDVLVPAQGGNSSPEAEKNAIGDSAAAASPSAAAAAAITKGSKKGRGAPSSSSNAFTGNKNDVQGSASPPPQRGGGNGSGVVSRTVGFAAASGASSPGAEGATSSGAASLDSAQLREDLSQHLVHMVLQIDVHAVVVATTRVLQCDRTLFRVLHQFCVLDARAIEQLKPSRHVSDNNNNNSNALISSPPLAPRGRRSGSNALSVTDTTSMSYSSGGGGLMNASRTMTGGGGGSLPPFSMTSPYSGSAATLAPYLASGSGGRGKRSSNLDATGSDSGAPVFNAAASFFITANFGDLRQMVNEVGVGGAETPNGTTLDGGDLANSHGSSLHGSRASGLGGSTASANASPRRSSSAQKSQQRQLNRSRGKGKRGGGGANNNNNNNNASGGGGGGGENFAKSFFKSFFGSGKKGGGGGLFTRGISNDVDDNDNDDDDNTSEPRDSWDGDSNSASDDDSASDDSRSGTSVSDAEDDFLGSTVDTSGTGSPPTPRSFGAASGGGGGSANRRRQANSMAVGSPRRQPLAVPPQNARRGRPHNHRHHHRHGRSRAKPQYSPWRDVPSYTALVSEFVRIFNVVLADAELSIDVRLGAGLLLPSVVLRDNQVFRLYEGRVLIRNYLSLLLHELQHNIKLRSVADDNSAAASQQQQQQQPPDASQDRSAELSARQDSSGFLVMNNSTIGNVVSGRAHLTQRELIAFAPRVIEALEQTFKVLGATPLTSDVASLTELPLYFFCADGKAPLGVALERSFTRVVVLWLIGLVGAQCDEDIDTHAMEVLLHLMSRAVTRGSLPKDSGTTLMLNAAGTATVVQISPVSGAAVPTAVQGPPGASSADWVDSRRLIMGSDDASNAANSGAVVLSPQVISASVSGAFHSPTPSLGGGGRPSPLDVAAAAAAPLAPLADDDSGDLGGLYRSHINNSLFDNTEFVGLAAAAGVDRAMAECGNTVEALGSVFRVLLGRSPELLTPAGLATVLGLFASHDSNVSRLGRECMVRSLETPSSYALYADVIRDSDTFALTQTLSVISAYLNSAALTPVARHERRVWMQRSGCVDAVVRVLVRVLDSPQSTPTFMKIIPHLFQLLSAFEAVDHKAPQLASTNFVAAVTERLEKLEGVEYFIIVTQSVLDSCMGTFGGVDSSYANYGGPGAHYAEMQVVGNFHIAQYNCAAEKPVFLELLPSLLRFAEKHNAHLYSELVEVVFRILECTGNVRADRLADFILDHGLSQMLPYLELSGAYIEERLPFTGSATELHRFWQPVLLRAPRRSELRFTSHGGVQVSVGTWPDTGFTIAAWFKFDRLYTTIPLFEFHGVMSEGGSGNNSYHNATNGNNAGGSGPSSPRGSTNLTALLFIFGGDSVQLTLNDARRTTVNESQALQNFVPNKWMHVCAVLRTTQMLDVYVGGFKVGTTSFPAYSPGTEVRVNVGCTDDLSRHLYGTGTGANVAPLFSMSDVTLWAQALSRTQVEAELAICDCRALGGGGNGKPVAPAKILEEGIPQELAIIRNYGTLSGAAGGAGAGATGGAAGLLGGGNFAGFAALMNPKSSTAVVNASMASPHESRGLLGLSFATTASAATTAAGENDDFGPLGSGGIGGGGGGGGAGGWAAAQSWLPISTRMARFVPYENDDNLLRNVLASSASYPVVAKLVGRYATPPKTWVDYPLLWATRGGVMRLLDWFHLVTSSAQLEGLLQLLTECIQRTTLSVTLDPRTYMLFAYMLTRRVAVFVTTAACDQLLAMASSHINVFDEEHRIVINRLAFEHILGNVAFYAAIPVEAALYLLQRVRRLFHSSQCRYARHNARFVIPYRFVDRLLHSLVDVAPQTPLSLRRAVVQLAQQVVVACDMEEGLVQIFVSLVAQLTPDEMTVISRLNPHVKVTLPAMGFMTHGKSLPLRTANHLTTLLFASLIECTSQSAFLTALARTVDLPWYASCLSRFADPASVVFATRLFFEAVDHNAVLQEEAMQHQSAIIEALTVHAAHEDLVLLLLALTVGAARHVDILSRKHSLLQQLDSVMSSFTAHPNSLVAPIFVKIFVVHLYRTVQAPRRNLVKSTFAVVSEQRLSYRVRRYFSLARVCSRLMILIRVRRYRALLVHHPLVSASDTPVLGPVRYHARMRSAGLLSNTSPNMSFAHSAATGTTTTALGNFSFASNAIVSGGNGGIAGAGAVSSQHYAQHFNSNVHNMPSFAASPLGLRDAAVLNPSDGTGALQSVSPQTPSLAGRSSAGGFGDGYPDDGDLPGERSVASGFGDARQLPAMLTPRDVALSGEDEGVDDAVPQWKPPVLLPDMWAAPPTPAANHSSHHNNNTSSNAPAASAATPSQPLTPHGSSLSHHPLTDPSVVLGGGGAAGTTTRSSANASRMTPPMSLLTSPTSAGPARRRDQTLNGRQTSDLPLEDHVEEELDEADHLSSSQYRVRSRKYKRAFAVLRVCVLLWLPVQVRRSRWVFTPHTQPYEEDYAKRHASTLFCIRMFRHFASFSSNFYLFVNSPLQTGALSALVAYISRDMLLEETDTWDQMVQSMVVAPVREPTASVDNVAVGTATITTASNATRMVGTPTTYQSSVTPPDANLGSSEGMATPEFPAQPLPSQEHGNDEHAKTAEGGEEEHSRELGDALAQTRAAVEVHPEGSPKLGSETAVVASPTSLPRVLTLPPLPGSRTDTTDTHAAAGNPTTATAATNNNNNINGGGSRNNVVTFADENVMKGSASTAPVQLTSPTSPSPSTNVPRSPQHHQQPQKPPSGSPTSATRRIPRISSMTFRSAESSSAQLDQMTVLESPEGSVQFADEEDDDVEDGVASSAATASRLRRRTTAPATAGAGGAVVGSVPNFAASLNDGDVASLPNMSFDADGPPSIHVTRVPMRRLLQQQQQQRQQQQQQQQHASAHRQANAELTTANSVSGVAAAAGADAGVALTPFLENADEVAATSATGMAAGLAEQSSPLMGTTGSLNPDLAASARTGSAKASTKTDEDEENDEDNNDGDDDDSSSVSSAASFASASSQSSVVSTNSLPTTFSSALPKSTSTGKTGKTGPSSSTNVAAAKRAVGAAVPSFSNLPDTASALRTHDPSDAYAVNIAKILASVGEAVRRDAVSILRALIRSSLDTLPVPHWISGPTYGSCGGLLFQMLLIVSAKAAADDATTTLVRFFLLSVGNAVKEQRDREMVPPIPRHDATPPLGAHSPFTAAPVLPGLGNPSFAGPSGGGGLPMAASPLTSRGVSSYPDPSNPAASSSAPLGMANASFASSAMPPSTATPYASVLGTPMPLAPTQQSAFLSSNNVTTTSTAMAAASSTAGSSPYLSSQRMNVPYTQGQRATSSSLLAQQQQQHHLSATAASAAGSGTFSDVFLFNVNHFTDLIVDMLAINVLDLPMATHYFLTLLVLCQGWPSRYIDQLSGQVMRACIAVLNRPSMQDASLGLIESVYTLSTLVLRRGWKRKGVLECLFRVLYRVYGSLPPAWMSDEDARHRKRLITLIFRHMVQTYRGTKELEKALTVRTLTQRLSLYDDFVMIFSLESEEESSATFEQYSLTQSSSLETLMSGRLKAKADLAFKASIKTRSEYIKRIKAFNNQYVQVTDVADRYRKSALRGLYASRFSSYVATVPVVDASQLHWLVMSTCALRDDHRASACGDHATSGEDAHHHELHSSGEATLYHFMDPQYNYGELKGVVWGQERAGSTGASHLFTASASANTAHGSASGSQNASGSPHDSAAAAAAGGAANGRPLDLNNVADGANNNSSSGQSAPAADASTAAASSTTEDEAPKNDLIRAAQCEELVQHMAVLLPPLSTRCRPHVGDEAFPFSLKDLTITLTPSAMTLLRYLLAPHETLRFISNGFRVNGIHATPCLILLTNTTLKVIGFSRVTEAGDIILCEYEDEDEEEALMRANNTNAGSFDAAAAAAAKTSPLKATRKNLFSMSSMTKQFQKFFSDTTTKQRQQQDGTRVAQAVRQVMGRNYQNVFWCYLVSSIRTVRSLRYMHLDTAVQLQLYYDNGPMLSVVDAKQSMNPSARKEFIKVLKDVVAPQQCTFIDESQRAASMKSNLVRWATGALSNYEYLHFLNEVAGRTNSDLNQYPVFPWVLADYASATLDLESPSTFRNFGYPMGAQTESRRNTVAQLFENTREVCDVDTGKSYPFHHGTHYSTSGGVLYFLLRAQPFTTYARLFQGGDFDLAMRLFDSVAASFSSCVTGPADCKELIPEFYVNNNFLSNADRLVLGVKSDGEAVDDVRLPPWAKNSRQVFTAVMRYTLESFFVVQHLHQWIDLVFGVRRRGPLAMERYNVFQRMTYGEEVAQALKEAETPHDCDVIIAEVDNFGQTPPQLFQERHPSHQELVPVVQGFSGDGSGLGGAAAAGGGGGAGGSGGGAAAGAVSGGGGGGGGRASGPSSGNISAITLGALYTSAHAGASAAGAGSQLGSTFSNLVSSGSFASGQTYTQAFRREAPKVVRILIHAMDEVQTWFVLRDPPNGVLQHPPPPALTENFRTAHPAVLTFTPLHTSKKLACGYAQLVPVADTDYYLCWYEREARLMRYTAGQAAFQSMVAFNPPDESGAHISAVAVGARESVLLIALSTGAVYCLFPDDMLNGALHLRVTLCYHRNPVEKIVLDAMRHRAVTITRGHSEDEPVLWRVQRSGCSFLTRLSVASLLPTPTEAELALLGQTAEDAKASRSAVDVAVDSVSGHIAIVTARSLLLFDNNGDPFGAGTLPSPTSMRAVDTVTLEDENGDVGVVVGRAVVVMPNLRSVVFYQTSEWAAGMSVLVTGHVDGSLSVWRCTRLPPDTVQPGKIAMVEFHARLFSGAAVTPGSGPMGNNTSGAFGGGGGGAAPDASTAAAGRAASAGRDAASASAAATSSFNAALANASSSPSTAALASTISSAGSVGSGTGATNCPVTCLYQERADVPTFLVGYENGSLRQLVFDDPSLMAMSGAGGSSGGGGGRDGAGRDGGDDRSQRR